MSPEEKKDTELCYAMLYALHLREHLVPPDEIVERVSDRYPRARPALEHALAVSKLAEKKKERAAS